MAAIKPQPTAMFLLVGLGNPGKAYENTRHNAGFKALDAIAWRYGFPAFQFSAKHEALLSEGAIAGHKVLLAKPQTFMNLSGEAVVSLVGFYKIPLQNLLVIYDDVDIALGATRLRKEGSAGGHNGMKSIIEILGTQNFPRLRIGIKPQTPFPGALEDFVLGKWGKGEWDLAKEAVDNSIETIEGVIGN